MTGDPGALSAPEARFGNLIEHLREVVFLVDLEGRWTFLNPAWTSILGFTVDESLGRPYHEHLHPDDLDASRARLARLLADEIEQCRAVYRMFDRTGNVHWMEIAAWVYRDGGVRTGLAGTLQDVTERVEAARQLEVERDRLLNVIQGTGVGVWEVDHETGRGTLSSEWSTMLGYAPGEVEARFDVFLELIHPDDRQLRAERSERLRRGEGSVTESTFRMRHKSGRWVWIRSRGRVVGRGPDGRPLRTVGTHTDVTDHVHAEQALRNAQKMEALGRVAGGIAHDFNNLLSVIMASADLLDAHHADDDMVTHPIAAIRAAAERAAALTRRLVEISEQRGVQAQTVDLNAAVRSLDLLTARALTSAITVEYELTEGRLAVEIDPGLFADVLLNLAINARDAMPDGGTFRIATRRDGDRAVLVVADTGCGMPPEVLARVWEPFFTTKQLGTGLGLPLAHAFVRQSDAAVDVASHPGAGTTFTFSFPISDRTVVPPPLPRRVAELHGRGELILVVDDEGLLRELARMQLEGAGYQVVTAADAAGALEILSGPAPVQLVFSDVVMPGGMTGFGLAEAIAAQHPGVHVLLTSGYDGGDERAGYTGPMLPKPYSRATLINAVRSALDG